MAPTTCRGFSAAMAARNLAPAECWAGEGRLMMAASLRLRADLYDCAPRDAPVHVGLECARQFGELDGFPRDAVEMARGEIRGYPLPHIQPFRTRCRRGID